MCLSAGPFDGNKVQVCTVGDLANGEQVRTPVGETLLTIDLPVTYGARQCVDIATGRLTAIPVTTKLGRDRAGRLYASRSLNPQADTPTVV